MTTTSHHVCGTEVGGAESTHLKEWLQRTGKDLIIESQCQIVLLVCAACLLELCLAYRSITKSTVVRVKYLSQYA